MKSKFVKDIVVCIIRNKKGELLLQKKTIDYKYCPGAWGFFGGAAESEDLNKEIERELKEELGLKMKPKFIFTKMVKNNDELERMNVFVCELNDASKINLKEGAGFAFFHKSEILKMKLSPAVPAILKEYFKK